MNKILFFFWLLISCGIAGMAQVKPPGFDVQHYTFAIQLTDANDTIKGQATITIKALRDLTTFPLNLVKQNSKGKGMVVSEIKEGQKSLSFVQDSDEVHIIASPRKNTLHSYTINYQGVPADGLIISTNKFGHRTFFGDNWPNRAHNWLPCADYPADKAAVDFIVTAPDHYQVVANGLQVEDRLLPNHLKRTHWRETALLPTKVMVIGVAAFATQRTGDVNGIPVYTYVFPENQDAGFSNYAVARQILPFYIKKVGPYAYKKLANIQSKTIYGGMENASTIFYFENSVTTRDIEELMAHEIAHQWFGDAATEKDFSNLWLSEGFATYMTNLYLENKYGVDTLKKRLVADRQAVFRFEKRRFTPVVDTTPTKKLTDLLNTNAYQKGGWALHMLRRKLGDGLFWRGIHNYYAKYNGANASTFDLQTVMEQASGKDLKQFFKQWLYTPGHPQLGITWKYDGAKGVVEISITQKQSVLFDIPLQIAIGGKWYTIPIKDKNTTAQFTVATKPTAVTADPEVNLLAGFEVVELSQ
jgi:aminopeptidase N